MVIKIAAILLFFTSVMVFASCSAEPLQPTQSQTLLPCASNSSQIYTGNFYPELRGEDVRKAANEIYAAASQNPAIAKREALKLLAYEAERWSSVQYVPSDPQPSMRVIVTFLTPGLIRAIVLNHLLSTGRIGPPIDLESATNENLGALDKREEFAFLILIQPEATTVPIQFSISPADIFLHTTDGFQVRSTHSDDYLNDSQSTSSNTLSGLFFYPATVMRKGSCELLLTPGMETSLMLKIDKATFADRTNVPIKWVKQFPLLYSLIQPMLKLDFASPMENSEDKEETPLRQAPDVKDYSTKDAILWRDIGRHIWWRMVLVDVPQ
ncbi:MAG: hypothetical protein WCK35_10625 [Chloroflexota bacterium]